MDKLKELQEKRDELWKRINNDFSEYFNTIIEISDLMGYRLRPTIKEDYVYDWVKTDNFNSVEELEKWEMETGFTCEMINAVESIKNNETIYATVDDFCDHFNIRLNKNYEIRRKAYDLNFELKQLTDCIEKLIGTDTEITFEEIRANDSLIIIKTSERPLFVEEKNLLYDNHMDIIEEFRDDDSNHCYKVKT